MLSIDTTDLRLGARRKLPKLVFEVIDERALFQWLGLGQPATVGKTA